MKKITPKNLFVRQTTLSEIGEHGQQKLLHTNIVVVGCGGLGTIAATYLAGSGIGAIHLVDFDIVSISNLHRQIFYKIEDVGKPKAEVLASYLTKIAPFTRVSYSNKPVSKSTIFQLIKRGDIVLDCTDSLPIKYLINDACVLKNKPLVYGSLYKFDGYAATFNIKTENGFTANLRDAFPKISKEAIPSCSEIGTLNTVVGIIGLFQANEVLKLVTSVGKLLLNELLIYNSLESTQYKMKLKQNFSKEKIQQIFENEDYFDPRCEIQDSSLLISTSELKEKLSLVKDSKRLKIISVIEDVNTKLPFKTDQKIPFSKFNVNTIELTKNNDYVVVCNRGITSYTAVQQLKEKYPNITIVSLKEGIINY